MHEEIGPGTETEEAVFVRVPGLLRRWEIERLLEPGCALHVEEAGEAEDGTPLFAVYRRDLPQEPSRE
jgi:hypothetical protein